MKSAAYGLCLILLALPSAAQAEENLVAKRELCRQEARRSIALKGKIQVDDYRRMVERRTAYVSRCINRSVVAHKDAPPQPQKALDDPADDSLKPVLAPAVKQPRRPAVHVERRKPKKASMRILKGKKFKRKKPGLLSPRRK